MPYWLTPVRRRSRRLAGRAAAQLIEPVGHRHQRRAAREFLQEEMPAIRRYAPRLSRLRAEELLRNAPDASHQPIDLHRTCRLASTSGHT